jgi:hypothetical protein
LGESAKFEFRVDAYNLFNKTNLDASQIDNTLGSVSPDGTVTQVNADFGVAGKALGSRTVQLQAASASRAFHFSRHPVWAEALPSPSVPSFLDKELQRRADENVTH